MLTKNDVGCVADGSLGHQHVRERMADMLEGLYKRPRGRGTSPLWTDDLEHLAAALRGPMSDDAQEEDDALDWLQSMCGPDVYFIMRDGDLLLVVDEDDSEEGW